MEKLPVWSEKCEVRFNAIDTSDRMTLDAVFNIFQEAAISHAENLGVGREAMVGTGQVWLLSRMSVQVHRRPNYGETVTARSWPRGWEKLFALRDYDIRDSADNPVVQARSGWIIIDMEKRRPLRPQATMNALPQNEGLNALPTGAVSLPERQDIRKTAERKALYSDIDYNGHVNNVSYIRWIEDIVDPALLHNAAQMRLDINYLNETLPGETVELWSMPFKDGPAAAIAVEGRRSGNQPSFRAELRLTHK